MLYWPAAAASCCATLSCSGLGARSAMKQKTCCTGQEQQLIPSLQQNLSAFFSGLPCHQHHMLTHTAGHIASPVACRCCSYRSNRVIMYVPSTHDSPHTGLLQLRQVAILPQDVAHAHEIMPICKPCPALSRCSFGSRCSDLSAAFRKTWLRLCFAGSKSGQHRIPSVRWA